MHITSTPCKETLFLLTVLTENQGNYTCVARNKFGESNSTKEIKIIGINPLLYLIKPTFKFCTSLSVYNDELTTNNSACARSQSRVDEK